MIRRLFFPLLLGVTFSLFITIAQNNNAYAVSDYDDLVQPKTELLFGADNDWEIMTDNYLDLFTNCGASQPLCNEALLQLQLAIGNNKGYAIIQYDNDEVQQNVQFIWNSEEVNPIATFNGTGTNKQLSVSAKAIYFQIFNGVKIVQFTDNPIDQPISRIYSSTFQAQPFLNTFEIEYPPGYEGVIITPPEQDQGFIPAFSYTVDTTGLLRVSYDGNSPTPLNGYGQYRLLKMQDNWQPDGEELDYQVQRPFTQYKYSYERLTEAGYYVVTINYDPDTYEEAPPPYEFVEFTRFEIYWDGISFITSTNKGGCPNNVCNNLEGENEFVKIIKGTQIPTFGLQQVVVAPLTFIASLLSYTNSCSPLVLHLPYLDIPSIDPSKRDLVIPCMTPIYQEHFSPILNIYQNIMIAIVSYYAFIRILGTVKDAHDPQINRIEVARL